jgi:hypothetical protein
MKILFVNTNNNKNLMGFESDIKIIPAALKIITKSILITMI